MKLSRRCKKCEAIKPLEDFTIHHGKIRRHRCKMCTSSYLKKYAATNDGKLKAYSRQYRKDKKSTLTQKKATYRNENRDKLNSDQKTYAALHKNERKAYTIKNRSRLSAQGNEYAKARKKRDPLFKMMTVFRSRMGALIRECKAKKGNRMSHYLGCDLATLRAHLESQFTTGMTWSNHGSRSNQWVVDHIKPCCSFDLTREEDRKICFHYLNLRPLWSLDNSRKVAEDRKMSIHT